MDPTDDNVIAFLKKNAAGFGQIDYLKMTRHSNGNATQQDTINSIMHDYDFIGVTERMDETAVALQMILGLETSDVMFLKK